MYVHVYVWVCMCVCVRPMLQPHLHEIVKKSMSLANTAQEPCNYFLLLRALFRSIGGGSHEQLYQEFLPLLSNLLQGTYVCVCVHAGYVCLCVRAAV